MTSDQFVAFIEGKLLEHGAAKVVPEAETLGRSYVGLKRGAMAQAEVDGRHFGAPQRRASRCPRRSPGAGARPSGRASRGAWDGALRAVVGRER